MPESQTTLGPQQVEPTGTVGDPSHGRETAEEMEGKSRSKSRKKKVYLYAISYRVCYQI